MTKPVLHLGGAWSSSWSIPGWMVCKLADMDCEERVIFLSRDDSKAKLAAVSPSGRVPVLEIDGLVLWDSFAIAEYLWERDPTSAIWPADPARRAFARSVAAEVHGHFSELRAGLPMNLLKRWPIRDGLPSNAKLLARPGVQAETARLEAIWRDSVARWGGPYVAGDTWCFADAMMAPMCSRYVTYGVTLAPDSMAFIRASQDAPLMRSWIARAEAQAAEIGRDICLAWP